MGILQCGGVFELIVDGQARCYFSFPSLLRRKLNPVWSRQAHVPDNKVKLTEKVSGIDSNLKVEKVNQKLELVGIFATILVLLDSIIACFVHRDFAMWRCFRANCGWAGQLIACFAERMISKGTLQRNSVMQLSGDQLVGHVIVAEAKVWEMIAASGQDRFLLK
ncbi:hypothetical protein Patl1_11540 [Pistacia atlantica]|uniref:Uncharacterized protein n=1 Tax=Pistacia atlantica TaxID=434234 RepID=A0ACC1A8S5_9ROSI|nr:hypothetical protein Patl1_11540 [Pistacia atlantica]